MRNPNTALHNLCTVAAIKTRGEFHCSRVSGHDGPCAPVRAGASLTTEPWVTSWAEGSDWVLGLTRPVARDLVVTFDLAIAGGEAHPHRVVVRAGEREIWRVRSIDPPADRFERLTIRYEEIAS